MTKRLVLSKEAAEEQNAHRRSQIRASQERQIELGHRFGTGKMAAKIKSKPRAR